MARSEMWYDEPEFLQNPIGKARWHRDVEGLDYSESEPPLRPSDPPLREIPMRDLGPEDPWPEPPTDVARRPGEMLPTVDDTLYLRSLRGSQPYTRDEVCRGYRKL
jgi:hypothetical protein